VKSGKPTKEIPPKQTASIEAARVIEWQEGQTLELQDHLAAEEPLQICVGALPLSVTMRTPGHDLELAAGFLFTEGLIHKREEIISLAHCNDAPSGLVKIAGGKNSNAVESATPGNVVRVELADGMALHLDREQRNFFASSSCGICGKASIESVRRRGIQPPNPDLRIKPEILCLLARKLRAAQAVFALTGGLHAAALFDAQGELVALREDVGRHNAVDKVIGWALVEGLVPLAESIMMVSGRGGFEIVQKAAAAGVPVIASVSAPSSLAVELALELNLTLVGFLRGPRFIVYSGEERLGLGKDL
jgi:FdhD protein